MPSRLALAALALSLSCSSARNAASVADKFVDKYYVESDQQAALRLADGLARVRLDAEVTLVGASRRGVQPGALTAKVFYDRKRLDGDGPKRTAVYALHIKPQGGPGIEKEAHLDLEQAADGSWRIVRFSETTPR